MGSQTHTASSEGVLITPAKVHQHHLTSGGYDGTISPAPGFFLFKAGIYLLLLWRGGRALSF